MNESKNYRPYSKKELVFLHKDFQKKFRLSDVCISHECKHKYYCRLEGTKYKNKDHTFGCSVCWKLKRIPKKLLLETQQLIKDYDSHFIQPNDVPTSYSDIDIETKFYTWLYRSPTKVYFSKYLFV